MVKYFAYGSNMDKNDMDKWCKIRGYPLVNLTSIAPARLAGYKLVFNYFSTSRNAGAANIMKLTGESTYGLLIELEERDRGTVRIKEGYPRCYSEIRVDVETFDGKLVRHVMTYKVVKDCEKPDHQPPTRHYLDLIIRNAKKYGFPSEYVAYLESIKTVD